MEKSLNKLYFEKLLVVATIALSCVCMWGCSDDVSFEWGKYRSDESIAGFIDDSLVIVTDCRRWHEITEGWNGSYSEKTSCGHDRMLIYNYRVQENGPRWMDSLTNESDGGYWKQLTDSIIWRWNTEKQGILKLWKIGQASKNLKLKKIFENCSDVFEINRIHLWRDGKFIALGGNILTSNDNCQYAVLDTVENSLTYKRLDHGLEWIEECDDVRVWNNEVYCLLLDKVYYNAYLVVDESIKDSMTQREYEWDEFTSLSFMGDILNMGGCISEIKNEKINCFSNADLIGMMFKNIDGTLVRY